MNAYKTAIMCLIEWRCR